VAIKSFSMRDIETFYKTGKVPAKCGWSGVHRIVTRKLDIIHYAQELRDLKAPPGNRLEALKEDFKGWHSIRINDQWRIVFIWTDEGAEKIDIIDYHG
jgi:toxin HigB-1